MKDTVSKLFIPQKKDVDKYFRDMKEINLYWIKVDIVKGRETDVPKFRVVRKKGDGKLEKKWHFKWPRLRLRLCSRGPPPP